MNHRRNSAPALLLPAMLLVAVAITALASCGGGDSAGSCPGPQTCGGNIVGTWNVKSSCASADPTFAMTMDCPSATGDVSKLMLTGSVTFTADGVETSTTAVTGSMSVTLPTSCLTTPQGTVVSCDVLSQAEAANLDTSGPFASISCKAGGGGCICTLIAKGTTTTTTGPYTTKDGTLSDTDSDGAPSTSSYCVTGDSLSLYNDHEGLRLSAVLRRQ